MSDDQTGRDLVPRPDDPAGAVTPREPDVPTSSAEAAVRFSAGEQAHTVGLTEQQCKEKKLDFKVGKFPFSASGRARTAGETEGFVKIIRDAKYGEILGAHIIGAHATELIHELAVARENEFTVEEIDLAVHAHPTMAEAVAEAALDSMGKMIHA